MPSFLINANKGTSVSVRRNQVFYACIFRLPEELKEKIPYSQLSPLECNLVMGFYSDPMIGDTLTYQGLTWQVLRRHYYPTRRNSRELKIIAELILELIGQADD